MDFFKGVGDWFGGLFGKKKKQEEQQPQFRPQNRPQQPAQQRTGQTMVNFNQPNFNQPRIEPEQAKPVIKKVSAVQFNQPKAETPPSHTALNKFGQPISVLPKNEQPKPKPQAKPTPDLNQRRNFNQEVTQARQNTPNVPKWNNLLLSSDPTKGARELKLLAEVGEHNKQVDDYRKLVGDGVSPKESLQIVKDGARARERLKQAQAGTRRVNATSKAVADLTVVPRTVTKNVLGHGYKGTTGVLEGVGNLTNNQALANAAKGAQATADEWFFNKFDHQDDNQIATGLTEGVTNLGVDLATGQAVVGALDYAGKLGKVTAGANRVGDWLAKQGKVSGLVGKGVKGALGSSDKIASTAVTVGRHFPQNFNEAYNDATASGMSHEDARTLGLTNATINTAIEKVSLDSLGWFKAGAASGGIGQTLKRALGEGAEEAAQSIATNAIAAIYRDVDWKQAMMEAGQAGVMGVGVGAIGDIALNNLPKAKTQIQREVDAKVDPRTNPVTNAAITAAITQQVERAAMQTAVEVEEQVRYKLESDNKGLYVNPTEYKAVFGEEKDLNKRADLLNDHLMNSFRDNTYRTSDELDVDVKKAGIRKTRFIDEQLKHAQPEVREAYQNTLAELDNALVASREATPTEVDRLVGDGRIHPMTDPRHDAFVYNYVRTVDTDGNFYEGIINIPRYAGADQFVFNGLKPIHGMQNKSNKSVDYDDPEGIRLKRSYNPTLAQQGDNVNDVRYKLEGGVLSEYGELPTPNGKTLRQAVQDLKKYNWSDKHIDNFIVAVLEKNGVEGYKYTSPENKTIDERLSGYNIDKNQPLYHGTSHKVAPSIREKGLLMGSELDMDSYRGGGYGEVQDSISLTTDREVAENFAMNDGRRGVVVETGFKDTPRIVQIEGIDYAENLNQYIPELREREVDGVWLEGESEIALINRDKLSGKYDITGLDGVRYSQTEVQQRVETEIAQTVDELATRHFNLTGDNNLVFNEFKNELQQKAMGYYDPETDTVNLNQLTADVLNHELVHKTLKRVANQPEIMAEMAKKYDADALIEQYNQKGYNLEHNDQGRQIALEEKLADEFNGYLEALEKGRANYYAKQVGLSNRIRAWFDRIIEGAKELFGKQDAIKQFYAQLETGKFRQTPVEGVGRLNPEVAYRIDPERALNTLKDFDDVLNGRKPKVNIAQVTPELAGRIYDATGIEIKPNSGVELDRNSAIHTISTHGQGGKKPTLPLTERDLAALPDTIEQADVIKKGYSKRGADRIVFEKEIGRNRKAVTEVIKKGDALRVVTYFNDSSSGRTDAAHNVSSSNDTSETGQLQSTNRDPNIAQDKQNVKHLLGSKRLIQDIEGGRRIDGNPVIHPEDQQTMIDLIDHARGVGREMTYDEQLGLEYEASLIAEHYSIPVDKTNSDTPLEQLADSFANQFERSGIDEAVSGLPVKNYRPLSDMRFMLAGQNATGYADAQAQGLVFDGVDGKPRFEVDDSQMRIKNPQGQTLGELIDHKELFKNYPQLKDTKVIFDRSIGDGARGTATNDSIVLNPDMVFTDKGTKGTLLHEGQHLIQAIEDFARGGSPDQFENPTLKKYGITSPAAKEKYQRLAGEAEARAVQARMDMPMSERYRLPDNTVYHGTSADSNFKTFKKTAYFTDDKSNAGMFSEDSSFDKIRKYNINERHPKYKDFWTDDGVLKNNIYERVVDLKNPLVVDAKLNQWDELPTPEAMGGKGTKTTDQIARWAKKQGYDGVKFENILDGGGYSQNTHYAVFDNENIKPANRRSTFYDSLDVPKKDLIIRNDGGKAMSIEPTLKTAYHSTSPEAFYEQNRDAIRTDIAPELIDRARQFKHWVMQNKVGSSEIDSIVASEFANYPELADEMKQDVAEYRRLERAKRAVQQAYDQEMNALSSKTKIFDNNDTLDTSSIKEFHRGDYELAKKYPEIMGNKRKIDFYEKEYGWGDKNQYGLFDAETARPTGEHGTIYHEYAGKPEEAIQKLLEAGEGEVPSFMTREDIGDIDLIYGKGGEDGYGLAHIVEKHGAGAIRLIPDVIKNGKLIPQTDKRLVVVDGRDKVAVRLDWNGNKKQWVATAYNMDNIYAPTDNGSVIRSTADKITGATATNTLPQQGRDVNTKEGIVDDTEHGGTTDQAGGQVLLESGQLKTRGNLFDMTKMGSKHDDWGRTFTDGDYQYRQHKRTDKKGNVFYSFERRYAPDNDMPGEWMPYSNAAYIWHSQKQKIKKANQNRLIQRALDQAKREGEVRDFVASVDDTTGAMKVERLTGQYVVDGGLVRDSQGQVIGNHIQTTPFGVINQVAGKFNVIEADKLRTDEDNGGATDTFARKIYKNYKDNPEAYNQLMGLIDEKRATYAKFVDDKQASLAKHDRMAQEVDLARPRRVRHKTFWEDVGRYTERNIDGKGAGTSKQNEVQEWFKEKYGEKALAGVERYDNFMRETYDKIHNDVNLVRQRLGKEEVEYRKDYMPHMNKRSGLFEGIGDIAQKMAVATGVKGEYEGGMRGKLPAAIAGQTEGFRPTRKWSPHDKRRTGKMAEYELDPRKVFERYADVMLYNKHIEPTIARVRSIETALRASDMTNRDGGGTIPPKIVTAVQDFANELAGKSNPIDRSLIDRSPEVMQMLRKLQRINGMNKIAGNVSSSLSQTLNLPETVRDNGLWATAKAAISLKERSLVNINKQDSYFLRERYGVDGSKYSKSGWQRVSEAVSKWSAMDFIEKAFVDLNWKANYYRLEKEGFSGEQLRLEADRATAKAVGGRGIGDMPVAFSSTLGKTLLQFQYETNEVFKNKLEHYARIGRDIKQGNLKSAGRASVRTMEAWGVALILNAIFQALTGREPLPDPVGKTVSRAVSGANLGDLTESLMAGRKHELSSSDASAEDLIKVFGSELLGGHALGSAAINFIPQEDRKAIFGTDSDFGRFEGATGVGQTMGAIGMAGYKALKGDARGAIEAGSQIAPFGSQLRKSGQATEALTRGYTVNKSGKPLAEIDSNWLNWTKGLLFGKNALSEQQQYYKRLDNGTASSIPYSDWFKEQQLNYELNKDLKKAGYKGIEGVRDWKPSGNKETDSKIQNKIIRHELSEEDYRIHKMSEKQKRQAVIRGELTLDKLDGLNGYVDQVKQRIGMEVEEKNSYKRELNQAQDNLAYGNAVGWKADLDKREAQKKVWLAEAKLTMQEKDSEALGLHQRMYKKVDGNQWSLTEMREFVQQAEEPEKLWQRLLEVDAYLYQKGHGSSKLHYNDGRAKSLHAGSGSSGSGRSKGSGSRGGSGVAAKVGSIHKLSSADLVKGLKMAQAGGANFKTAPIRYNYKAPTKRSTTKRLGRATVGKRPISVV